MRFYGEQPRREHQVPMKKPTSWVCRQIKRLVAAKKEAFCKV